MVVGPYSVSDSGGIVEICSAAENKFRPDANGTSESTATPVRTRPPSTPPNLFPNLFLHIDVVLTQLENRHCLLSVQWRDGIQLGVNVMKYIGCGTQNSDTQVDGPVTEGVLLQAI
jgi:hypothetical protein